jgi:hypothetical protein
VLSRSPLVHDEHENENTPVLPAELATAGEGGTVTAT